MCCWIQQSRAIFLAGIRMKLKWFFQKLAVVSWPPTTRRNLLIRPHLTPHWHGSAAYDLILVTRTHDLTKKDHGNGLDNKEWHRTSLEFLLCFSYLVLLLPLMSLLKNSQFVSGRRSVVIMASSSSLANTSITWQQYVYPFQCATHWQRCYRI